MSLEEVVITNSKIFAALSGAREGRGVHIYLDVPVSARGLKLGTTLRDTHKGKVKDISYTALLRARSDNAMFALKLVDNSDFYALEVGLGPSTRKPYLDRSDKRNWIQGRADLPDPLLLKAGDLVSINVTTTQQERYFDAYMNGKKLPGPVSFRDNDLNHLWRHIQHHSSVWTGMEVLEHHFLYSNIGEATEPDPATGAISMKGCELTHLSIGGRAIITGSYEPKSPQVTGVSIGLQVKNGAVKREHSFGTTSSHYTVSLGPQGAMVTSENDAHFLQMLLSADDFVYLIIYNLNIQSLEIHTGMQALG